MNAQEILSSLRQRLLDHRPSPTELMIDSFVLPISPDRGEPDRVLGELRGAIQLEQLRLSSTLDPQLNDQELTFAGRSDVLGIQKAPTTVTFTVSADLRLEMQLEIRPEAWSFGDSFPELSESVWGFLPLIAPRLVFSTVARAAVGDGFALQAGLNLAGTLRIPRVLSFPTSIEGAEAENVWVSGPVSGEPGSRILSLTAAAPVKSKLPLPGFYDVDLNARLELRRSLEGGVKDVMVLRGEGEISGRTFSYVIDLPNPYRGKHAVAITFGQPAAHRVSDAVAMVVGLNPVTAGLLDAIVGELAISGVSECGYEFDPSGFEGVEAFVRLKTSVPWGPWAMPIAGTLEFRLRRKASGSTFVDSPRLKLTGRLTSPEIDAEVEFAPESGWDLRITATSQGLDLEKVAGLIGMEAKGLLDAIPMALRPSNATISGKLAIHGGAATGKPEYATFEIGLSKWQVFEGLKIEEGKLSTWVDIGRAKLYGRLATKARLGNVGLSIELPLPPGSGEPFRISMVQDEPLEIGIDGLIAMFGDKQPPLPQNLGASGALRIEQLDAAFRITDTPAFQHIVVAIAQAEENGKPRLWEIIPGKLGVSRLRGRVRLEARADGVAIDIAAGGDVTICKRTIDVYFWREPGYRDWVLAAGQRQPLVLGGGLKELADWLNPGAAGSLIGKDTPFAEGIELSNLYISFDGNTGAIKELSFGLAARKVWSLIPGKLSIESLYCRLQSEYPVSAESINGVIGGVVKLCGAEFHLSAEKTKSADGSNWQFQGELVSPVSFELASAANSLSENDKEFDYPLELKKCGTFPPTLTIRSASIKATPETGQFEFRGAASFSEWRFTVGAAESIVAEIETEIARVATGQPIGARIAGKLTIGALKGSASVRWGGGRETVLEAGIEVDNLNRMEAGSIASNLAGSSAWNGTAPTFNAGGLRFAEASLDINLTRKSFAFYGTLKNSGTAFLVSREQTGADGGSAREFLFGVKLTQDFHFGDLIDGLKVIDDVLKIQDARLVVYSLNPGTSLDSVQAALLPAKAGIAELVPKERPSEIGHRGALFFSQIAFEGSPFQLLSKIGRIQKNVLDLTAFVNAGDPSASEFAVGLASHLEIFPSVRLTEVHARYCHKDQGALKLEAVLNFDEILGSAYVFRGVLRVDSKALTGEIKLAANSPNQWVDAFRAPGIHLEELRVEVGVQFEPRLTKFTLHGTVRLAEQPISASLLVENAKPVLAEVSLNEPLSIGRLLKRCFSDGRWPGDLIDLEFQAGSRIYYYDGPGGDGHQPGFNVDARARLTLGVPFDFTFLLHVIRESGTFKGVQAKIALVDKSLDLIFVAFTNPEFELDTTGSAAVFRFRGIPTLFGVKLPETTVSVSRNSARELMVTGTLTGTIKPFGRVSLTVTYTSTQPKPKFALEGWGPPDLPLTGVVKWVEAIRQIMQATGRSRCSLVAGFISENMSPETKFHLTPNVKAEGDELAFYVEGSADVSFDGVRLFEIKIKKPLRAALHKNVSLNTLPGCLIESLAKGGVDFVEAVLGDPENLAKLLFVVAGPALIKKIVLELVCSGLTDGSTVAAAEAIETAQAAAAAAGGVFGMALAIETIKNAIASHKPGDQPAVPRLTSFQYVSGVLEARWTAVKNANLYELQIEGPKPQTRSVFDTRIAIPMELAPGLYSAKVRAVDQGPPRTEGAFSEPLQLRKLALPEIMTALAPNEERKLTLAWKRVEGNAGYRATLSGLGRATNVQVSRDTESASIPIGDEFAAGAYKAFVTALAGDDHTIPTDGSPFDIRLLAPVAVADLTVADGVVTARWSPGQANHGYTLRLVGPYGPRDYEAVSLPQDADSGSIKLQPFAHPGEYRAQVRANAGGQSGCVPSVYGAVSTKSVFKLGQTTATGLKTSADDVIVNIRSMTGAASYEMWLIHEASGRRTGPVVSPMAEGAHFPVPEDAAPGYYRIQVRAIAAPGGGIDAELGTPSEAYVRKLAPPNQATLNTVSGVRGVERSIFRWLPGGSKVQIAFEWVRLSPTEKHQTGTQNVSESQDSLELRLFAVSGKVRMMGSDAELPSPWCPFELYQVPGPVKITRVKWGGGWVSASWDKIPWDHRYEARLTGPDGQPVPFTELSTDYETVAIHAPELAPGHYHVQVRTIGKKSTMQPGAYGTSEEFVVAGRLPVVRKARRDSAPKIGERLQNVDPVPVIEFCGLTFWPFDYFDNQQAVKLVALAGSGNVVGTHEIKGPYIIQDIRVENETEKIRLLGLGRTEGVIDFDDLRAMGKPYLEPFIPPVMPLFTTFSVATPRLGMLHPALVYAGARFFPFDFADNRNAFLVVAFDEFGACFRTEGLECKSCLEKGGARNIVACLLGPQGSVTWIGADRGVQATTTLEELRRLLKKK